MSMAMPKTALTKIVGEPSAMDIILLEEEVLEIAGSMDNPGSSRFGHVGMLLSEAEYLSFRAQAGYVAKKWKAPKKPGPFPRYKSGDDKEEFKIYADQWTYTNNIRKEFINGKRMLKAHILAAIDEEYMCIRDPNGMMMGLGPKELLDYLKATYRQFTGPKIFENHQKLNDAWDGRSPIEEYWEKMRKIRKFATLAKARISDIDCIFGVLTAMQALPDFARACQQQRSTPLSKWSWTETVKEFTKVNMERANKPGGNRHLVAAAVTGVRETPVCSAMLRKHEIALSYCHSCGWSTDRTHDSTTCKAGKPGHNKEATAFDNKGCCQQISMRKRDISGFSPKQRPKKRQRR
jgi:hypothetical protein